MRQPLALLLRAGMLTRRYLGFLLPRAGSLLARMPAASTRVSGAAYRRGLTLGWAAISSVPLLLDTPHLKTYKLMFDTRLYAVKNMTTLGRRAAGLLEENNPVGRPVLNWHGCAYSVELGGWGEKTPHTLTF